MFDLDIRRSHLEWEAIAPYIGCLYRQYLTPELQKWARETWGRLREFGLTRADSPLDTLDSLVRAINLFDFHRVVVYHLGNLSLDMAMDETLINVVNKEELKELAVVRYDVAYEDTLAMDESVSSAIGMLYMRQIPTTIRALYSSFGSPDLMHENIMEYAVLSYKANAPLSNTHAGVAKEYIDRIATKGREAKRIHAIHSLDRLH